MCGFTISLAVIRLPVAGWSWSGSKWTTHRRSNWANRCILPPNHSGTKSVCSIAGSTPELLLQPSKQPVGPLHHEKTSKTEELFPAYLSTVWTCHETALGPSTAVPVSMGLQWVVWGCSKTGPNNPSDQDPCVYQAYSLHTVGCGSWQAINPPLFELC